MTEGLGRLKGTNLGIGLLGEGQGPEVPALPRPPPNPQKGSEKWANGPTFQPKSVKGLGEGALREAAGVCDPWPPLSQLS